MKIFDLHCDTAFLLWKKNLSFSNTELHINSETISALDQVVQTFAFWSDTKYNDEQVWIDFLQMYKTFNFLELPSNLSILLSIEDLRLIDGEIGRIALLKQMGISFAGLFWAGENPLGAAHNSSADHGLTPLGKEAVLECFREGIIVDVSHASHKSTEDILTLANAHQKPVIASHSNFFDCKNHTRNLHTDHAKEIKKLGGLIGLSFIPEHLGDHTASCFARHLEYGINLGLESCICLGTDFDGTSQLINGVSSQKDLPYLRSFLLESGFKSSQLDSFFWHNGMKFLKKTNIKSNNTDI